MTTPTDAAPTWTTTELIWELRMIASSSCFNNKDVKRATGLAADRLAALAADYTAAEEVIALNQRTIDGLKKRVDVLTSERGRLRELLQEIADADDAALRAMREVLGPDYDMPPECSEIRNRINEALKETP